MTTLELVLIISLIIVFIMYLCARSNKKDTEERLKSAEERITRDVCKKHWLEVQKLLELLENTPLYLRKDHEWEAKKLFSWDEKDTNVFENALTEKIKELRLSINKKIEIAKSKTQQAKQELHDIQHFKQQEIDEAQSKLDEITRQTDEAPKKAQKELRDVRKQIKSANKELHDIQQDYKILLSFADNKSNLSAIPYMAAIMADYETYGLEVLAKSLDWGYAFERMKKVKSIREIRKDAQAMVEKNLQSKYQLAYLLQLFPNLEDVIETDYNDLPIIEVSELSEYDRSRDWLSKEEYQSLDSVERNQLALDRYVASHNKTKWQIGRDYELSVGYRYSKQGFTVDYFGSYMGLEDLGRDLICKKDGRILIVQCKYWSQIKEIHEKHVTQLYGTMISYCIEHNISQEFVQGVLITNISLSKMAKQMADYLNIKYKENYALEEFPRIKCNINYRDGIKTKIYHLPFDQQYDATKIDQPGEFYAMTVQEAENAGFRRAFKWFGAN